MDPRTDALVKECRRQYDNCRYTAASLHVWQKYARVWRAAMLIAPIILGGFASSQILVAFGDEGGKLIGALCALLAGFFPAIFKALNLDVHLESIANAAGEFTNLRDRFRQAANIKAHAPYEEFQAEFEALMDRMDAIRKTAPPAPEWCFKQAQAKISGGDYDFDIDQNQTTNQTTPP